MNENKKIKRVSFEDQISLMLFACHATETFSVADVQEAVFDFHRATVYRVLNEHIKSGFIERVSDSHYKATQYAKDIMNVKEELVA